MISHSKIMHVLYQYPFSGAKSGQTAKMHPFNVQFTGIKGPYADHILIPQGSTGSK